MVNTITGRLCDVKIAFVHANFGNKPLDRDVPLTFFNVGLKFMVVSSCVRFGELTKRELRVTPLQYIHREPLQTCHFYLYDNFGKMCRFQYFFHSFTVALSDEL